VFFQRSAPEHVRGRAIAARQAHSPVEQIRRGTRILVVDDNPENVVLLQTYLNKLPVFLDFASNGLEAIEKRRINQYDLILMDIQMPVMDGYMATREIRAWERATRRPQVPVIALTAHALAYAASESRDAGCDLHVTKPIEREDLIAAIAKFAAPRSQEPTGHLDQQVEKEMENRRPEFLAKRRADLVRIREAVASQDFGTIKSIGHNCKGIGKGYGFPEIGLAGAALESAARAEDQIALASAVRHFSGAVEAASSATVTV
jgi:CheY-like chemotaxis protein